MFGLQQTPIAAQAFNAGNFGANNFNAAGLNPNFGSQAFGGAGFQDPMSSLIGQHAAMSSMINQMMTVMLNMTQMMLLRQMQTMMSSMSNFGGTSLGGSTGLGNFLGDSAGGASSVGGSAPTASSSDFGSIPGWGASMAKDAEKHAVSGQGGWCFKYVCEALARAGVKGGVGGASAYMAADQLAKNPKFREVTVAPKDLPKLPAGAVVVWDRNGSGASEAGRIHGHISIALGDGREVSDVIRKQTTNMGSKARVFLPQ